MRVAGLILAGGRSLRFGSEKAMAMLEGEPLIARVARALSACDPVAVSARPDSGAADWARIGTLALLCDPDDAPDGPLSGLREGLRWARAQGAELLAVVPCDTPDLTPEVIATLIDALSDGVGAALAETPDGLQPLVGVWRCAPALALLEAMMQGGAHPPVRALLTPLGGVRVHFAATALFANTNTPADLASTRPATP